MRACKDRPVHSLPASTHPDWGELLVKAINTPGVVASAYSRFWNYSVGNQILAWMQCIQRKIEPGPIHTFIGWKDLGRYVKKGEKGLTLCMPCTLKAKSRRQESAMDEKSSTNAEPGKGDSDDAQPTPSRTVFIYRAHWFVLSQTQGKEYVPAELPQWSESRALSTLKIERIDFRHTDGNAQGYAQDRQVAVSPIAFMPARTLMHELAHVALGHTQELHRMDDDHSSTPHDLREVEAECVALICCSSLNLGGEEFSRGYIQHWLHGQTIPERSAQRIFKAADQILKAGRDEEVIPSDSAPN